MWKLESDERVARWRDFRKTLDSLPLEQALAEVVDFWHSCPFAPYYLDVDALDKWPNPWELISENYYCDLAKALGMLYTIYFTAHGPELDPEIHIYYDTKTDYSYNLVILCQGKYVLNFHDTEIVNIESITKNLKFRKRISSTELKLEIY